MDSPIYSQDEFDLNLPLHHQDLQQKFHFLLEKSIASTKGNSPLNTPEPSIFDFQTSLHSKLKKKKGKIAKKCKKLDVFDKEVKLMDMVSNKTLKLNKEEKLDCQGSEKKIQKSKNEQMKPPKNSKNSKMKWNDEETDLFYRSLEQYGTDFSIIGHLFKNRDRIQIKNKFLKEEKSNPEKIHFHLNHKRKRGSKFNEKLMKFHDMFVDEITANKDDKKEMEEIPHFTLDEFHNSHEDADHLDHKINHHVCEIIKAESKSYNDRRDVNKLMKKCL